MPQGRVIKTSFNSGEITPLINGRADLDKYFNSCQTLKNMACLPLGAATTRPGFKYVAAVKDSTAKTYLYPFRVSDDNNYMLEFGNLYIRIYKNQARVGTVEITTPYLTADLPYIKIATSVDTMYIACSGYRLRKLVRVSSTDTDSDAWQFDVTTLLSGPTKASETTGTQTLAMTAATGNRITFTAGAAFFQSGDIGRSIRVVQGGADIGATPIEQYYEAEAIISEFVSSTVVRADIIKDFPASTTIPANQWKLVGTPTGGLTPTAQGPAGRVISVSTSTFNISTTTLVSSNVADNWWLVDANGNYYLLNTATPYSATAPDYVYENGVSMPKRAGSTNPKNGQWCWGDPAALGYDTIIVDLTNATPDPDGHSPDTSFVMRGDSAEDGPFRSSDVGKYMYINGGYGKIIAQTGVSAKLLIIRTIDSTSETFDWAIVEDIFDSSDGSGGEHPSTICFYEDRLVLGGTPKYPQSYWGSATGDYERFPVGTLDADSFSFTILSRELTEILWLEPRDSLFIGTTGGVWRVDGGVAGSAVTPTNVSVKQATTEGCSAVQGISKGSSLLYVHEQGRKVMDIGQETDLLGNNAVEVSMLAEHLMTGTITQFCYQSDPYGICFMVRSDGLLLGMTYLKEQDVIAFHRHVTDGTIEAAAVISGSSYDELWVIVNRTINGATVRYIEVMQQWFLKANTDDLTNYIHSDAAITVTNTPASKTVSGLSHLEGEEVTVLADGKRHRNLTVASGAITLDYTAEIIQVGLAYDQQLTPQYLVTADGSNAGIKQRVVECDVVLYKTMTAKIGKDLNNLDTIQIRKASDGLSTATPLFTGIKSVSIKGGHETQTTVTVFNNAPTPMTVSAIIHNVEVGDG